MEIINALYGNHKQYQRHGRFKSTKAVACLPYMEIINNTQETFLYRVAFENLDIRKLKFDFIGSSLFWVLFLKLNCAFRILFMYFIVKMRAAGEIA